MIAYPAMCSESAAKFHLKVETRAAVWVPTAVAAYDANSAFL
jgi:hypothetical protein